EADQADARPRNLGQARPLKKAHLLRWLGRSSRRRTTAYVSVVAPSPPRIWTFLSGLAAFSPNRTVGLGAGGRAAGQKGQHRLVQAAVGRQGRAGVDRIAALEVGEPPARFLDQDLRGRHVPWLDLQLGVNLSLAFGEHPVPAVGSQPAL